MHLSIVQSFTLLSILSFYHVTTAIVSNVLSVGIIGQYRWFTSLLPSKRRRKLEKKNFGLYDEHVYGEWCDDDGMKEEFSILLADVDELGEGEQQMGSLVQMAQRVSSSLEIFNDKEEKAQLGIGTQLCTVELFCWPFGRKVYVLKNARSGQVAVDDKVSNMVEVEYWTPKEFDRKQPTDRKIKLPKTIRLKTQLILEDGQIKVSILSSSTGLSREVVGRILRTHAHFWQDRLPQELDVILARRKQLQSHAAASKIAAKAKKAAKLDRIAHPEKYKQLSPTVRRTGSEGSGGGSGRYVPSEATQARRIVKRGG